MGRRKPTTIYRPLFREALRIAWERKSLWVFGLFAAVLSTGGVAESAARTFQRLGMVRDLSLQLRMGTFTGTELFGRAMEELGTIDPSWVTGTATGIIVVALLVMVVSVSSQGALIAGVGARVLPAEHAAEYGRRAFWHMLALNLLHKAAHVALTAFSTLVLLSLLIHPDVSTALGAFFAFLILFPFTIIVAVLFMLASVHAVREGSHALDAVHHALVVLRTHWIAAFETGLVLFAVVSCAVIGFILVLGASLLPFALLVSLALILGNAWMFLAVNILGGIFCVFLLLAFAGATTAFQYAVWVRFYDHAVSTKKTVISKAHRLWHGK